MMRRVKAILMSLVMVSALVSGVILRDFQQFDAQEALPLGDPEENLEFLRGRIGEFGEASSAVETPGAREILRKRIPEFGSPRS